MNQSLRNTFALFFSVMVTVGAAHATPDAAEAASASTAKVLKPLKVKPNTKIDTAGKGAVVKRGENEYPTGQLPVPPRPKKEGLEIQHAPAIQK